MKATTVLPDLYRREGEDIQHKLMKGMKGTEVCEVVY